MNETYGKEQLEFLVKKDMLNGMGSVEGRVEQFKKTIKPYNSDYYEGLSDRIGQYILDGILSPSSPQWSNFGVYRNSGNSPLPTSCYVLSCPNSIQGIYHTHGETAMMSKLGGGVGVNFSNIYDKGTYLEKDDFYTNSKLDWIEDTVSAGQKVSQGNTRRGYSVPTISLYDAEFDELLDRASKKNPDKRDPLVSNNISILLPKGWMDRVKKDVVIKKRYFKCLKERTSTGKIYLLDEENMNKNTSGVYTKLGHNVDSSNICVTGDQMVATKNGFKTVLELYEDGGELELFDNISVNKSSPMIMRRESDDVYEITLKNGLKHKITKDHKVLTYITKKKEASLSHDKRNEMKSISSGLTIGDEVCFQTNKGVFGNINKPKLAFVLGLFQGDGVGDKCGKSTTISLWENDFDLIEEVQDTCCHYYDKYENHPNSKRPKFISEKNGDSGVERKNLHTVLFKSNNLGFTKGEIPNWLWESDEETQWAYLRGLLYADGTVGSYNNSGKSFGIPVNLFLNSIDKLFLEKLQILFLNLGVSCEIHKTSDKKQQMLPKNGGSGEYGLYNCNEGFRLLVCNKNDLIKLEENTNFLSRRGVEFEKREYRDNTKKYSHIIKIEHVGQEPVYCPTVDSEENLWVCNGIITSNCVEITTPSYDDKSFSCNICSLNLKHWDVIKANPQIIKDVCAYLDINVTEVINKLEGVPFMEKARKSAMEKRDIGLGTLGFHEYIQSEGVAFGSLESRMINKEIYSTIQKYCLDYTKEIGSKLGSPKMCEEADLVRRNVSLMCIAPNKSSSFIMGCTSAGIEPFQSNYFVKELAGIQTTFRNPYLKDVLKKYDKDDSETWAKVLDDGGSVKNLDFLSDEEKSVFKTAYEISPKDMIDLVGDRQVYIDMGQSFNLFHRPNYTLQDVYNIHKYAWERGVKTLYYYYNKHSALEEEGGSWDSCESCAD